MKITLTEKQLDELKGQYKDEVEIIYRDPTIVCMIPKSQMTSSIYGMKTNWCQTHLGGFRNWSSGGLLIRFLFKNGRKVRFTYHYDDFEKDHFHWANESGWHVLEGRGNPFEASSRKQMPGTLETDILARINEIPVMCKRKVLQFIKTYKKKHYEYCYRDDEYTPPGIKEKREVYNAIMDKYRRRITDLPYLKYIRCKFNETKKTFLIEYSPNFSGQNEWVTKTDSFLDVKSFQHKLEELIEEYELDVKNNPEKFNNNQIAEAYPGGWNVDVFKSLKSFSQRVVYCHQHLQRISSGSSRIVYKIDEDKVLKLAKNRKGIEQNENEYQWRNDGYYHYILGNIIDGSKDGTWIEMELAQKISPNTFKKFMGVSFNTYSEFIRRIKDNKTKEDLLRYMTDEEYEKLNEDEFTNKVINFINDGDFPVGDYCRLSSYGMVNREGVPTLVLIDYGITEDILKNLYHRK